MIISGPSSDNKIDDRKEEDTEKELNNEVLDEKDANTVESKNIAATTKLDKIPDAQDVQSWDFITALESNPLYNRPPGTRVRMAYKTLYKSIKPSNDYLLPGQLSTFYYEWPKTKEQLKWYDRTPVTIFFGFVRNKQGKLREIGFNLHYYPPFLRKAIMETIFKILKNYFIKNFDTPSKATLSSISYGRLMRAMKASKLEVGVREYIPGLRKATRVIPTKYMPEACLTEGNFSGATAKEIFDFWKNFRRK
jgi:hypothetical protein